MRTSAVILFGFAVFAQTGALRADPDSEEGPAFPPSQLLTNARGENARYTGIARIAGSSACTGFLAAVGRSKNAPAVVLTNGHCAQRWWQPRSAFDVVRDSDVESGSMDVIFNYFVDTQDKTTRVPVKSIRYSTMKGIDLAVLELAATTRELMQQGITPLPIAESAPAIGSAIHVVGAPNEGVDEPYLRKSECLEEGPTDVVESYWHWYGSHRNHCSDILPGSSGSPVLDDNGRAYAIMNTTSEASSAPCDLDNPCEVASSGIGLHKQASYGSSLIGLQHCFDAQGRFQPETEGCPLETSPPLISDESPRTPARPVGATGEPLPWGISLEGPYSHVWTKLGLATETDCRDIAGYSAPIPRNDPSLAARPLPSSDGVYFLCMLGVSTEAHADLRFPAVAVATIDTTPPQEPPRVMAARVEEGGIVIELGIEPPELADYRYAFGPLAETDCHTAELRYLPYSFMIRPDMLPAKLCVQVLDSVGNSSPMQEYEVVATSEGRLQPSS